MTKLPTVDFGSYLEQLRADQEITPANLARAAGIDRTTIQRWIRGDMEPTLPGLRAIAPHLGVRLGDLLISAGMATAAELGTVGSPPPLRAPLPPQLQRVVSRLLDPKVTAKAKTTLLNAIGRTVDLWEEMLPPPKEPRMRRKTA